MIKRTLISLIAALASAAGVYAGESADSASVEVLRPVQSAYMLKGGSAHIADTYLSPVKYSGWNAGFEYQRLQAMAFNPTDWVMGLRCGIEVADVTNRAGNSTMWDLDCRASWTMMRRWQLPQGVSLGIGPAAMLNLGALYLSHNGNNPVSAKASIDLGASGYAAWNLRLRSLPVTVRYDAQLPVIGAFFSPDYGELYYEIYLGNHSGLAHCGWWGNHFRYDHRLTADFRFGATALRIGYSGEIFSSKVNHLVTRRFTHSAIVGISGEWLSLNPRRQLSTDARIISATY
ncbi:MAG: DUF3316 domain-containing protein [Paramuribaculum sp.]|nr:DUF3316 domain-containing protein [Paramuribaculum sp.]